MTSLNPVLTIGRQIGEALEAHFDIDEAKRGTRAAELLDQVGIPNARQRLNDYPHQFSGGMRQRAMIAMALAVRAEAADRRRADDGARRHDPGADPRPAARDRLRARRRADPHHARPRRRRRHVRARARHVRGHVRRDRRAPTRSSRSPRHPYTYGLLQSIPRLDARRSKLQPIKGAPRNMLSRPDNCPFSPRCPNVIQVCIEQLPPLDPLEPGHRAACFNPVDEDAWRGTARRRRVSADDTLVVGREPPASTSRSGAASSSTATSATSAPSTASPSRSSGARRSASSASPAPGSRPRAARSCGSTSRRTAASSSTAETSRI